MANQISKVYGANDYLDVNNLDFIIDIDKKIYLRNLRSLKLIYLISF